MTSLEDIALMLGEVREGVRRVEQDMSRADESRTLMQRRLEELNERVIVIEGSVALNATEVADLKAALLAHQAEVQPTLQEWKRMKTLGAGMVGLIALGGVTIGSTLVWAGDTAVSIIRHWLKIG